MKILVTGAAGFIGSHTCELLESHKHTVLALDDFSTGYAENLLDVRGNVEVVDITDILSLPPIFQAFRPHAVLHLAAQSAITVSLKDPQRDLTVNVLGTLNLLRMAREFDVGRFVFSSTSAVYAEEKTWFPIRENFHNLPQSPYGISKLTAEHYVRTMFPSHCIFRYGNVYGPRQRPAGQNQVVARAFRHFLFGDDFSVVGSGNQTRDFVYVEDIAYANLQALTDSVEGTYNVASGKSRSVNHVLGFIERIYGVPGYRWMHTQEADPRGDVAMNVSAIRRDFGWEARVPLEEGLRRTADWWNDKAQKEK